MEGGVRVEGIKQRKKKKEGKVGWWYKGGKYMYASSRIKVNIKVNRIYENNEKCQNWKINWGRWLGSNKRKEGNKGEGGTRYSKEGRKIGEGVVRIKGIKEKRREKSLENGKEKNNLVIFFLKKS